MPVLAVFDVGVEARWADAAGNFHVDMCNTDGTSIRLEYPSPPSDATDNLGCWYEATV